MKLLITSLLLCLVFSCYAQQDTTVVESQYYQRNTFNFDQPSYTIRIWSKSYFLPGKSMPFKKEVYRDTVFYIRSWDSCGEEEWTHLYDSEPELILTH